MNNVNNCGCGCCWSSAADVSIRPVRVNLGFDTLWSHTTFEGIEGLIHPPQLYQQLEARSVDRTLDRANLGRGTGGAHILRLLKVSEMCKPFCNQPKDEYDMRARSRSASRERGEADAKSSG